MQVALRQDVAHQHAVLEPGDQPVGGFPVAVFLDGENLSVQIDVGVDEDFRKHQFDAVGAGVAAVQRRGRVLRPEAGGGARRPRAGAEAKSQQRRQ